MEKLIDRLIRNIVYLYLIILPWLVMPHKSYYTEDEKLLFASNTEGVYDIFLYWKMVFTIAVSIILLVLLVVSIIKYNYKIFDFYRLSDKIILICLVIYTACTVMSYVCAQYRQLALTGGVNSFEGTIVLLSYVVLFLAGRYIVQKCEYRHIEYIAMFNAILLFVLSLIEVNYKSIAELVLRRAVEIDYPGMLCLTFYNPSYCAGFIIILLAVCLYYYSVSKQFIKNAVWGCLSVTTLICGFLTRSSAAFYILLFEMAVFVVTMTVNFIRNIKNVHIVLMKMMSIVVGVIAILLIDLCAGGRIFNSAKSASVNETTLIHKSDYYKVNNIELNGSKVCITGDNNKLVCGIDSDNTIYFTDETGKIISVSSQGDKLVFPEPYSSVCARIWNDMLCLDLGYKGELRFLMYNNTFYPALSDGSAVKDISAGTNVAAGRFDSLFTGRGYIWRNTLPVIRNTLVFGHGAGTFEMYFKQFDFVGLLNSQGNVDLIVDKPHSLYLQMTCNQGLLCSIAVVTIFITLIVINILAAIRKAKGQALSGKYSEEMADKDVYKSDHNRDYYNNIYINIFAALLIAAFMVFELITDSNITVNPIMVVIAGMIGADIKYEIR